MGEDADDIYSALPMTADERKRYDPVKSKLDRHFIIKRNVIFERAKFNLRFQKENESVDKFITDLFTLDSIVIMEPFMMRWCVTALWLV